MAAGRVPIVLAGNCNSCLGTVAGLPAQRLGAVSFDAHADFDSPEDNRSGFFDVMGLSILTGGSWRALRESIPGFQVIREQDVVLIGVRDLEPYQRRRLGESEIRVVEPDRLESMVSALAPLHRSQVQRLPACRPRCPLPRDAGPTRPALPPDQPVLGLSLPGPRHVGGLTARAGRGDASGSVRVHGA